MSTKKTEDGFLSRWSRRKLEGKAQPAPDEEEDAGKTPAGDEASPPAAEADGPAEAAREGEGADDAPPELTEEDVEKLGPGADYSVFMKKGVSAHVQRLALRKLWRSNPVLANLDGLVDYNDDYRIVGDAGEVASSWKVGKGLLKGGEGAGEDDGSAEEAPEDVPDAAPGGDTGQGDAEEVSETATGGGDEADKA